MLPGHLFALAACCLTISSCTWEEFPKETETLQRPVELNFVTAVDNAPKAETRVIKPGTDFGGSSYFEPGIYTIGLRLNNLNGTEMFEGSDNVRAELDMQSAGNDMIQTWTYYVQGQRVSPRGVPRASARITAYHPYDQNATTDSIPFDFTGNVNVSRPHLGQTNLLLCSTRNITIPATPETTPIELKFKNAYTKVVLRITKREDKNDPQNAGVVTETSIDNLTSDWIKNRGGIDPATGYVKPASQPGKIWNDSVASLTTDIPVEFTFLVPAFMDNGIRDDQFGFVMEIDGQQRLFPLKRSQLNTGMDAAGRPTYGFEQNKINTYNLVYNNSLLFLGLQSWNTVDASANFGESAGNDPVFTIDLTKNNQYYLLDQSMQAAYDDYPKDKTPNPWSNSNPRGYIRITTHLNNTYLSSVLLGGNGPNILDSQAGQLYDFEKPYAKLQVTAFDVGGKPVIWQDENGGLIAKDVCRNYRGNGYADWRLPRVTEMKAIMMWAVQYQGNNVEFFTGGPTQIKKAEAVPYWTATEAFMGTAGVIDAAETAWYVQGYYDKNIRPKNYNYKVLTRNKQDAAYIRCVREMDL